jgi:hypothetical protein
MSDPVVVWVVDDWKDEARTASVVVGEIAAKFKARMGVDPVVLWADSFRWPPFAGFRTSFDPKTPPTYRDDYPDLVILDLFKETADGFKLKGDAFYYALRKWEGSKPGLPSFVIPWSQWQGEKTAEDFIDAVQPNDHRLIPLATKKGPLLARTVAPLWERIVEERG